MRLRRILLGSLGPGNGQSALVGTVGFQSLGLVDTAVDVEDQASSP